MNPQEQNQYETLKNHPALLQVYVDLHKNTGGCKNQRVYYWKHQSGRRSYTTWLFYIAALESIGLITKKKYGNTKILIKNEVTPEFLRTILDESRRNGTSIQTIEDRWTIKNEVTQ